MFSPILVQIFVVSGNSWKNYKVEVIRNAFFVKRSAVTLTETSLDFWGGPRRKEVYSTCANGATKRMIITNIMDISKNERKRYNYDKQHNFLTCRIRKPLALKLLLDQGRVNEILIRASKYVITERRRTNATQQTRNQSNMYKDIYKDNQYFGLLNRPSSG